MIGKAKTIAAKRRRTLTTPDDLAGEGLIAAEKTAALTAVAARYAVAITPAMADLIDVSDPDDPIARQFVPSEAELEIQQSEIADPIGDDRHSPVKGIVHRYRDRVLLKLTHVCPVYCRFCFRREMVGPGEDQMLSGEALEAAFRYIASHGEIWEVVMTGGDPFMLSPRRIADVTKRLAAIAHVKVLRWHTRVPVAEPQRVNQNLVRALHCNKAVYVAIHVNHPHELTVAARQAVGRLADAGIPLVSQSVLLKGVNDDPDTLEALMRALIEARIKPYYLHHPDLAPGTGHFRLSVEEGQELIRELRARASGLCQPHYVLDIPGGYSKAQLAKADIEVSGEFYLVRDAHGMLHRYK